MLTRTAGVMSLNVIAALALACSRAAVTPLDVSVGGHTRLLVVAPHPDDESIGAAGLIRRVRAMHGTVKVVVATSGDAFAEGVEEGERIAKPTANDFRGYGQTREHETVAAMERLGVPPPDVTFLGFPDEGLCTLATSYLSSRGKAYESPFTDRNTPPPDEQVIRGTRYRGTDLERELRAIIVDFSPTILVVPHPEDEHPDHCSAYIFATAALQTATIQKPSIRPRILHYLVHYGQWPIDIGSMITQDLRPPIDFPRSEGRWVSVALTAEEAAAKREALETYTTQIRVIGRFLRAFARGNELFVEGKPSTPECWCDAEHVATELPPQKRRARKRKT